MNFARAKAIGAGQGLADALFADLADGVEKMPLERFCSKGGWPLDAKISTIAILADLPDKLKVLAYVSFTETGAACCSGDNFEHEHFEELPIHIDKASWTCEFPAAD